MAGPRPSRALALALMFLSIESCLGATHELQPSATGALKKVFAGREDGIPELSEKSHWAYSARVYENIKLNELLKDCMLAILVLMTLFAVNLSHTTFNSLAHHRVCKIHNVPAAMELSTISWTPRSEEFPELDNDAVQNVMVFPPKEAKSTFDEAMEDGEIDKHEFRAIDRSGGPWHIEPYNRFTRQHAGSPSIMLLGSPGIEDGVDTPDFTLLIALNCKELEDITDEGFEAFTDLGGYLENLGNVGAGRSGWRPVLFTFLTPKEGYTWALCPAKVKGDAIQKQETLFVVKEDAMESQGCYLPLLGMKDWFKRSYHHFKLNEEQLDVPRAKFKGRSLFNVVNKATSHRRLAVAILVATITISWVVLPMAFLYGQVDAASVKKWKLDTRSPTLIILNSMSSIITFVIVTGGVGYLLPRIKEFVQARGLDPVICDSLYVALMALMAAVFPVRDWKMALTFTEYYHGVVHKMVGLVLGWFGYFLALFFFGHSMVVFYRGHYNMDLPEVLNESEAEFVLGLMGVIGEMLGFMDTAMDLQGVGDMCDMNKLHDIFEKATENVTNGKKLTIRCNGGVPKCNADSEGLSSDTEEIVWERLHPGFYCTGSEQLDQKNYGGTQCDLTCTTSLGSITHTVECGGCSLVGSCWGVPPSKVQYICPVPAEDYGAASGSLAAVQEMAAESDYVTWPRDAPATAKGGPGQRQGDGGEQMKALKAQMSAMKEQMKAMQAQLDQQRAAAVTPERSEQPRSPAAPEEAWEVPAGRSR